MNSGIKTALLSSKADCFQFRAALFHSSPVLERRRRNHWESRCNDYSKRFRRMQAKQTLLRNVSAYTDFLFQSWQDDGDEDPTSSKGSSWFKRRYTAKGSRRGRTANPGPQGRGKSGFQFTEDDADVETIFRSAFGGNRFFYWSFINEENPRWRSSENFSNNYGRSWNWRYRVEEEDYDDCSTDSESSDSDLSSERLALGLSAYGPLKVEDIKNAYRACALKWHPDRHQGSSKALAEEKFKLCSAAYQSLCDKLVE